MEGYLLLVSETLQTNVLVDRSDDGQDENWMRTPARWPLPRHCFARTFFTARAYSHVGPLLERQGQGNPLRPWGQHRGDRRSIDSHWTAEPAIENSLAALNLLHTGVSSSLKCRVLGRRFSVLHPLLAVHSIAAIPNELTGKATRSYTASRTS